MAVKFKTEGSAHIYFRANSQLYIMEAGYSLHNGQAQAVAFVVGAVQAFKAVKNIRKMFFGNAYTGISNT